MGSHSVSRVILGIINLFVDLSVLQILSCLSLKTATGFRSLVFQCLCSLVNVDFLDQAVHELAISGRLLRVYWHSSVNSISFKRRSGLM